MEKYILKRTNRKTISITIDKNLKVIVKAPKKVSINYIEKFLKENESWIVKAKAKTKSFYENKKVLSKEEIDLLKEDAKNYLPKRVAYFEEQMNLKCSSIKVTSAKTRWGSCSSKNSICFSYRVMLLPKDVIDYIVVHELAHIVQKNHSNLFYEVIEKYLPNYLSLIKELRKLEKNLPL